MKGGGWEETRWLDAGKDTRPPSLFSHTTHNTYTLQYTLTRSCSAGKPPIRFAGHAAARRPGSASLDGGGGGRDGGATAGGNADDDVECVAVYGGGTWTLHAVEAAVSLRVKRGEEVTTARPPALPPSENADDDDATTSDDELGAELEAALEEEEEGRRQPPQQPAPARGTLPSAELNDVEREFLGRG